MQLLLGILNINYVEYKLYVQNPNSKIIDMVKQIEVSGGKNPWCMGVRVQKKEFKVYSRHSDKMLIGHFSHNQLLLSPDPLYRFTALLKHELLQTLPLELSFDVDQVQELDRQIDR